MTRGRITTSVQKISFSYAYDCIGCGDKVHLTGDTMPSFHEATQLFGKQLCVACDVKRQTLPAKKKR